MNKMKAAFLAGSLMLTYGCSSMQNSVTDWRMGYYTVQPGDSVSAIAWRYDLDVQDILLWNNLQPPYIIHPGQKLVINGVPSNAPTRVAHRSVLTRDQRIPPQPQPVVATTQVYDVPQPMERQEIVVSQMERQIVDAPVVQTPAPEPTVVPAKMVISSQPSSVSSLDAQNSDKLTWTWPINGKIMKRPGGNPLGPKGIDILGSNGQTVVAASSGTVIFSGKDERIFGHLVIIQHENDMMTAYANNESVNVREGDNIRVGDEIARVGRNREGQYALSFQIRRDGEAVDPLRYLPSQR